MAVAAALALLSLLYHFARYRGLALQHSGPGPLVRYAESAASAIRIQELRRISDATEVSKQVDKAGLTGAHEMDGEGQRRWKIEAGLY